MKTTKLTLLAAAALLLAAQPATRAATEAQAQALGKDLTPMGAERAASSDGTIPEWKGGDVQAPSGWKPGSARPDPYAADKPLFSVTAANAEQYKAKLTEGQMAMLKQIKGYRMDVYPTRRSCGYPQAVYDNTRKNATGAKLAANGFDLGAAVTGGIRSRSPPTAPRRCGTTRCTGSARAAPSATPPCSRSRATASSCRWCRTSGR